MYKSLNSNEVSHKIDNRIVGITPCRYCVKTKSSYRAETGEVFCCEEHQKNYEKNGEKNAYE